jgi:hypothetical protein
MNDEEVIVAEEGVQPEPSDPFDVADSWNSAKRTDGPDNMEVDSSDEDEDEDEDCLQLSSRRQGCGHVEPSQSAINDPRRSYVGGTISLP